MYAFDSERVAAQSSETGSVQPAGRWLPPIASFHGYDSGIVTISIHFGIRLTVTITLLHRRLGSRI